MVLSRYLIDTSAAVRMVMAREPSESWRRQISSGRIAICAFTELELRHGAISIEHDRRMRNRLSGMFTWVPVRDRCHERALEVQDGLIANGEHRSAGVVDLMLAANAELSGLTVLHDDKDFECVARVTGQPVLRVNEL